MAEVGELGTRMLAHSAIPSLEIVARRGFYPSAVAATAPGAKTSGSARPYDVDRPDTPWPGGRAACWRNGLPGRLGEAGWEVRPRSGRPADKLQQSSSRPRDRRGRGTGRRGGRVPDPLRRLPGDLRSWPNLSAGTGRRGVDRRARRLQRPPGTSPSYGARQPLAALCGLGLPGPGGGERPLSTRRRGPPRRPVLRPGGDQQPQRRDPRPGDRQGTGSISGAARGARSTTRERGQDHFEAT